MVNEKMEIPWGNTPLHQWAKQVHEALDIYREATIRFENPKGVPRVTLSPLQVQWYQEWEGPHRWVTCEWFELSPNMVCAYFWIEGEWEMRDRRIVTTDDVPGFVRQVWDFLKLLKN